MVNYTCVLSEELLLLAFINSTLIYCAVYCVFASFCKEYNTQLDW